MQSLPAYTPAFGMARLYSVTKIGWRNGLHPDAPGAHVSDCSGMRCNQGSLARAQKITKQRHLRVDGLQLMLDVAKWNALDFSKKAHCRERPLKLNAHHSRIALRKSLMHMCTWCWPPCAACTILIGAGGTGDACAYAAHMRLAIVSTAGAVTGRPGRHDQSASAQAGSSPRSEIAHRARARPAADFRHVPAHACIDRTD